MVESTDFGDTLDQLATFGSSIGTTIGNVYQKINPPTVARTNIPQSGYNVAGVTSAAKKVSGTEVAVLVGLGIALAWLYSRARKRA